MALGGRIEIDVVPNLDKFPDDLKDKLEGSQSAAETAGNAIGIAIAAGTALAAVGFKQAIDLGIEFQNNLNNLQAVSHATDSQMKQVSATASRLGSDLTLPATSAADAAEAMLELAKGGLTVEQAMTAARGTLQLAAAAQISGAQAAEIQANALNAFALGADQAGHVADVLANASNAASGEITDFGAALEQVGTVSQQFGVSLDDTVTALGLFANAGIKGSDAGTLLKTALVQLANPTKPAIAAMHTLGLTAFDATGKFVGLESIFGQLNAASKRLTPEMYAQAASTVFGTDAVRLAGVAANTTSAQWDTMAAAVSRAGGAQEVAAAKMKGLGGALEGLNSQLETAQLQVFDAFAKPLEQAVRAATTLVPQIGDAVAAGIRTVVAVGNTMGPSLAAAISSGAGAVGAAATSLFGPFIDAAATAVGGALLVAIQVITDYGTALSNIVAAAAPVAAGLGQVADAAVAGDGALTAVGGAITAISAAFAGVSAVLVPIGALIGGLVSAFAALPGPIQSVVFAMLALRFAGPLLASLASGFNSVRTSGTLFGSTLNAVTAPARLLATGLSAGAGALRQFGGEMAAQRGIAAGAGQSISTLAAAQAAFRTSTVGSVAAVRGFSEQVSAIRAGAAASGQSVNAFAASMRAIGERVPVVAQMGAAFRSAAAGAGTFGAAAGTAAAAATGLRAVGTGIIGALGGPFGAAITAAVIGIGLFASANAKSKAEVAAHQASIGGLTDALKQSGGAFSQAAKEQLATTDEFKKAAEGAKQFGTGLDDLSQAAITGGAPLDALRQKLQDIVKAETTTTESTGAASKGLSTQRTSLSDTGQAAQTYLDNLNNLVDVVDKSKTSYADFAASVGKAGGSLVNGAQAGSTLNAALLTLASAASTAEEKTNALKAALDALSGGQLSLEEANSKLNASMEDVGKSFDAAAKGAAAAKTGLLDATGGINTTTAAGRQLLSETTGLRDAMGETAQAAFNAAGGFSNLGPATTAARDAAQRAHDSFVQAAQAAGLNATQAEALAQRYGLIPNTVVTLITAQGLPQVNQELLQLQAKFAQIPGTKTITTELTGDAQQRLRDLGFTVEAIPGSKEVKVTAPTDVAIGNLNSFVSLVGTTVGRMILAMDPAQAQSTLSQAVNTASNTTGMMKLDGEPTLVNGKITQAVTLANGSKGVITLDGEPNPATGKIDGVITYANGQTANIKVDAPNVGSVNGQIDNAARGRTATITVNTVYTSSAVTREAHGGAIGGIVHAMDRGGVVQAQQFKKGGIRLTPMKGGIAQVVKPNSWRVIGDRVVDDEAYIPINTSMRSKSILMETARRMGFQIARKFATGGVASVNDGIARQVAVAASRRGAVDVGPIAGELAQLRQDLTAVRRQVQVTNQFFTEPSARESDVVLQRLRRQAALGLFG